MRKLRNDEPCSYCGRYSNRGVSVDAVIIESDRVLLIKRKEEPYKNYWGTPGGYVEWDETSEDTVARELKEETNLNAIETKLLGVYSYPSRHPKQVINLLYLVKVDDASKLKVGDDALEAKWFPLDRLPDHLAFDHKENIEKAVDHLKTETQ